MFLNDGGGDTQKGETIAHVFHTFYEKPFVASCLWLLGWLLVTPLPTRATSDRVPSTFSQCQPNDTTES